MYNEERKETGTHPEASPQHIDDCHCVSLAIKSKNLVMNYRSWMIIPRYRYTIDIPKLVLTEYKPGIVIMIEHSTSGHFWLIMGRDVMSSRRNNVRFIKVLSMAMSILLSDHEKLNKVHVQYQGSDTAVSPHPLKALTIDILYIKHMLPARNNVCHCTVLNTYLNINQSSSHAT